MTCPLRVRDRNLSRMLCVVQGARPTGHGIRTTETPVAAATAVGLGGPVCVSAARGSERLVPADLLHHDGHSLDALGKPAGGESMSSDPNDDCRCTGFVRADVNAHHTAGAHELLSVAGEYRPCVCGPGRLMRGEPSHECFAERATWHPVIRFVGGLRTCPGQRGTRARQVQDEVDVPHGNGVLSP